jgi:hypothetical protein
MGSSRTGQINTHAKLVLGATAAALVALLAQPAQAAEGGASVYLLGSGGPEAAILPPIEGIFFQNTVYYYNGSASAQRQFVVGGSVVAGLDATIVADFPAVIWVPTTDFLGGTVAVGAVLPFGQPSVDVSAVITGPGGGSVGRSVNDEAFVIGDPLLTASLGWTQGKTHVALSTLVNIPIGDYREDELANLAFHRWAVDTSLAGSWNDPTTGWDVSGKVGFTFNGENPHTDYQTGIEMHLEAAVQKTFSKAWAGGIQGYYYEQLTGDSGAGARLGPFEGRVSGVGLFASYNFKIGPAPATLRLHGSKEFNAANRMEGEAIWLDFSMPLHVNMPPGASGS